MFIAIILKQKAPNFIKKPMTLIIFIFTSMKYYGMKNIKLGEY